MICPCCALRKKKFARGRSKFFYDGANTEKKINATRRKNCRDWESHPGFRCHKAGYCYYTISARLVLRHRCWVETKTGREISKSVERCGALVATLAKRLMRLPRKQKVVSSNLTGGSFFFFPFAVRPTARTASKKFFQTLTMSQWPNWIRRLTTNQEIGGSSPSWDIFFNAFLFKFL